MVHVSAPSACVPCEAEQKRHAAVGRAGVCMMSSSFKRSANFRQASGRVEMPNIQAFQICRPVLMSASLWRPTGTHETGRRFSSMSRPRRRSRCGLPLLLDMCMPSACPWRLPSICNLTGFHVQDGRSSQCNCLVLLSMCRSAATRRNTSRSRSRTATALPCCRPAPSARCAALSNVSCLPLPATVTVAVAWADCGS